jgi:nitroreductase
MPTSPRRRRLVTTTVLAVLTAGTLAAGAAAAGAAPATAARRPLRAVTVTDPLDTGDAIADLRSASVAVSPDLRHLTVTARFEQPTSPTSQNWWFGSSLPRAGITWGLNTDPGSTDWQYVAELRGDPVMGAYGYVAKQVGGAYQLTCRAAASFDGTSYRVRFPVGCIGGPDSLRFTAYGQLYHDSGEGIIGGDYAPGWGELSDWLRLR